MESATSFDRIATPFIEIIYMSKALLTHPVYVVISTTRALERVPYLNRNHIEIPIIVERFES